MTIDEALEPLFQPITINGLTIPNRLAMPPMTRSLSPGNTPHDGVSNYYARRAAGGTGLLITEGVGIDHNAAIGDGSGQWQGIPVMYGEAPLAGWRKVTDAVHDAGGVIFPQLWHQGPFRVEGTGPVPEAPSMRPSGIWGPKDRFSTVAPDYIPRVIEPTRPMTESEIGDVIAGFARSAALAVEAGFDGIAIHGASGYLVDSFFWNETNQRTDRYGGDMAGRATFGVELVRAVRAAIGPNVPMMFRFGQWKQQDFNARIAQTPDELGVLLGALSDASVDVFDASTLYFSVAAFPEVDAELSLAGWAKKLTGKPSVAVGGVGLSENLFASHETGGAAVEKNWTEAARRIGNGEFDMIAVGRALIADADWAKKVASGETPNAFARAQLAELN